jgi:CMP-2-keto-3-deoxyoctulosonic acid synthetase
LKRKIKPKRFDNFENDNIVNNSDKNNSKALETTVTSICNTEQYKNSFFIRSVIHWNQLTFRLTFYQKFIMIYSWDQTLNQFVQEYQS